MASSGSFNTNSYGGFYMTFAWSVKSQSKAGNSTTISWTIKAAGGTEQADGMSLKFGSTTVWTLDDFSADYSAGETVGSGTYTFTHGATGTKSFSATFTGAVDRQSDTLTGSGSWSLPAIDLSSVPTLSASSVTQGPVVTVFYNRRSSAYVHDLKAIIGGTTYELASWSPYSYGVFNTTNYASEIYAAMGPTGTSTTVTISVTTFNETLSNLGTHTVTLTVYAKETGPTVGACTYADTNASVVAITGSNQTLVQNKSTPRVTIASMEAANGANLASVQILRNGVSIGSASLSGSTASNVQITMGVKNIGEAFDATVRVTDSRGYKTDKTMTMTFVAYADPMATISCKRQSNYYAATDLLANATFSQIGSNALTMTYATAESGGSYGAETALTSGTTTTLNLDNTKSWNVRVSLSDSFGGSKTYIVMVDIGIPIVFFDRLRRSVGINQFPDHDGTLEVTGKIYLNGTEVTGGGGGGGSLSPLTITIDGTAHVYDGTSAVSITITNGNEVSY